MSVRDCVASVRHFKHFLGIALNDKVMSSEEVHANDWMTNVGDMELPRVDSLALA